MSKCSETFMEIQESLQQDIRLLESALEVLKECGEVQDSQMRALYSMIGAEIGLRKYQLHLNDLVAPLEGES